MSEYIPRPSRMVMKPAINYCEFCINSKGISYDMYISYDERFGYISCYECKDKSKKAAEDWKANEYGKANFLQGKELKVKRSSGIIETNWKLDENKKFIFLDYCGREHVFCTNIEYYKWVLISELLELNA